MKIWLLFILLMAAGCSFKKNPHSSGSEIPLKAEMSESDKFLQKIRYEDEVVVVKYIEGKPKFLADKSKASDILKAALVRGSVKIVRALLQGGVSPYTEISTYRGDSSFDRNAFSLVSSFNANIAAQIASTVISDDFDAFQQVMHIYSLSCETIVDLIQEYRTSQFSLPYSDPQFIRFLGKTSSCKNLAQSPLKHEWMIKEIFRLYTQTDRLEHPDFFMYLSHLFQRHELKFQSGIIVPTKGISAQALIMYKIKQVSSPQLQTQLMETWMSTIDSISMPNLEIGIVFSDNSFYVGPSKLDSPDDIDRYFKFNVIDFLNTLQLAARPNCFVLCGTIEIPNQSH